MTTTTAALAVTGQTDRLSGTSRASALDRWIYVATAAGFILIILLGFIPDSLGKIAAVDAGRRAPFPIVLHAHAVLMGAYLLLLQAQTVLVAMGRTDRHRQLGLAAMVLGPLLVAVGILLVPTMYHLLWNAAQAAPARAGLQQALRAAENVLLVQGRVGLLFPVLLFLGLRARKTDPGFHKRMMMLSVAIALPAGVNRISWLPNTMPASPLSGDLCVLLALAPMFVWDLVRNRRVHAAYWVWLAVVAPVLFAVYALWDTPWWHHAARRIMGV